MKATVRFAALALVVATAMFTVSCGGNASKKKAADGATETKTEAKADAPKGGAIETTPEVQSLLEKYGLSVDAIKPQGAIFASVVSDGEYVRFLLPKGAEFDKKANFTKMLNAVKAIADDGKIWEHDSKETEYDMTLYVDNSAAGHSVDYIYKGNTVSLYLSTGNNSKPGENNPLPSYSVRFNHL